MRFLDFSVQDPLNQGRIEYPFFRTTLDEYISPWKPAQYGEDFNMERAGAFFRFLDDEPLDVLIGEFNQLPADEFSPRLAPIQVTQAFGQISEEKPITVAIDVKRVQMLMRRFDIEDWTVGIDEHHALTTGLTVWRPVPTQRICGGWVTEKNRRCTLLGLRPYVIQEMQVWLCSKHARQHNEYEKSRRISA